MRNMRDAARRMPRVLGFHEIRTTTAALLLAVVVACAWVTSDVPVAEATSVCPPEKTAAQCAREGLTNTASRAGLVTDPASQSLPVIIGRFIYGALSLTGVIFVILMVYAGFLWMQARGKTEDIEKARKIIETAIIGIVITALAFAITNFVLNRITEAQTGTEVSDTPTSS